MSSDKWNGASLVLVVVENCLDRHAEEDGERVALIWEKDRPGEHEAVTYRCVCGWCMVGGGSDPHYCLCLCVRICVWWCALVLPHSGVVLNVANDCTS